jgi:hypothetical protein
MRWSLAILCIVLVGALTLASGAIQGRMTFRWGIPEQMTSAAERLNDFPRQFGDWRLQAESEMDPESVRQLEPAAYVSGTYVNEKTREAVYVLVVLGPYGRIAVHTPEVCMGSQAFQVLQKRQTTSVPDRDGQPHAFWGVTFRTTDVAQRLVRVYYGWSTGDDWSAPENARYAFVGSPYLYKVQLSSSVRPGAQGDDACVRFLRDFVSVAKQYLIQPST